MPKHFKTLITFIVTLSFSGFIWSMINIFFLEKLPTNYIYIKKPTNFYNIHLEKIFTNTITTNPIQKITTLKSIKLKAIFEDGKNSFIIIDDKKDIFLNLNQKYKGYKLIKVTQNSAIFTKNNKQFEIKLNTKKTPSYTTTSHKLNNISKQTLKTYTQNPKQIWKNISIVKTVKGYKITYIKKDSIFDKLGLKKGDIILSINNQILQNDSDAWNIYKHINDFDEINMKIKRNNQIKELNYEIY
jgi:general secretion pathway protein C